MAVAFQEYITQDSGSATSLTATGFSGLAAGDLMVAQFFINATGRTITLPDGNWTEAVKTEGGSQCSQISYKIADAGDVSGNSFQFSISGGATVLKLRILRITGHRGASPIAASGGTYTASSATINAPTVTPSFADSLIMFFTTSDQNATTSSYATATSSPTFSEHYDSVANTFSASCASGLRSAITATGAGTATLGSSGSNIGQLVVVSAPQVISVNDECQMSDTVYGSLSIYYQDIVTATDVFTSTITRLWTKLARNIKTWTNYDR